MFSLGLDLASRAVLGGGGVATWSFRRAVTVDNTGNSNQLLDYQIPLTLSSSNFSFASAKSDGSDLRFTDSDDATLLNYWIERYDTVAQSALVWVKIPFVAASSSRTIYLHYGNARAAAASNGDSTFPLFDHFETGPSLWVPNSGNPTFPPTGGFEGSFTRDPFVMVPESAGDTWKMWYWGANNDLGFATSTDGIAWTRVGEINVDGARPSVVKKDGTYYLFVNAGSGLVNISVATATNPAGPYSGLTTVLTAAAGWEGTGLFVPSVIYDDAAGIWKMWYTAATFSPPGAGYTEPKYAGYATSSSPTSGWTKHAINPIISPAGDKSWFNSAIQALRITKLSGVYYGFMTGADVWGTARFGLIQSMDGIEWNFEGSDLDQDIGPFDTWNKDFIYAGNPVFYNNEWRVYFNGRKNNTDTEQIGMATLVAGATNTLNAGKWKKSREATITVDSGNSIATINTTSSASQRDVAFFSHYTFADGILEARLRIKGTLNDAYTLAGLGVRFDGQYYDPMNNSVGTQALYEFLSLDGSTTGDTLNTGKLVAGTETVLNAAANTVNRDTWYVLGLSALGTALKSFRDYVQIYSGTDSSVVSPGFAFIRAFQSIIDIDWVRVRRATTTEPSISVGVQSSNALATVASPAIIVPDRLIGYWPLKDGNALDKSNWGNAGLLSGATPPSASGDALNFNGSTGFINIGDPPILNAKNSISISAWVYLGASFSSGYRAIFGKWNDSTPRSYLLCLGSSGSSHNRAVFFIGGSSGATFALDSGTLQPAFVTTWKHIVAVYDRPNRIMRIYVDGAADGTLSMTDPAMQASTRTVEIGNHTSNNAFWNGKIGKVRAYDRAISAADVSALYAEGAPS